MKPTKTGIAKRLMVLTAGVDDRRGFLSKLARTAFGIAAVTAAGVKPLLALNCGDLWWFAYTPDCQTYQQEYSNQCEMDCTQQWGPEFHGTFSHGGLECICQCCLN